MRLLLSIIATLSLLQAATPTDYDFPLGPIGGSFRIATGDNFLRVSAVMDGAPGAIGGLQKNDYIYGSDGVPFDSNGSDFQGATRQIGWAIGQAQATDGILTLDVFRSGSGLISLDIDLGTAAGFSPAYPLNSPTFQTVAEGALDTLNQRLIDSNSLGYPTGWGGLSLLASPHWNDTTGPHPYRLGVDKIYAYSKDQIERAQYAPVEQRLFDGTDNPHYNGDTVIYLENWYLGLGTMFLAEYYSKTLQDPPTPQNIADFALLQDAAEKCANRIQWWRQPQSRNEGQYYTSLRPGIVGHGNVGGDYMHYTWGGGINIVGVHLSGGLVMAKNAGVDMTVRPVDGRYFGYDPLLFDNDPSNDPAGQSLPTGLNFDHSTNTVQVRTGLDGGGNNVFAAEQFVPNATSHSDIPNVTTFLDQQPTLDDKLNIIWDFYKRCQSTNDGHINYLIGSGSLGDSGGRTPGVMFTTQQMQSTNGAPFVGNDLTRVELFEHYHNTQYDRHLNSHVTNIQSPSFLSLSASSMGTRERQHFYDNWRFFYQLTRNPDHSTTFFRGRSYGGAGESNHADEIYFALANGVAAGGLNLVEGYNTADERLVDWQKVPHLRWQNLATKTLRTNQTAIPLDLEVTDGAGAPTASYTAAWTTTSGATFSNIAATDTIITVPGPGVYDVLLTVTDGAIITGEPLRIEVEPIIDDTLYSPGIANYAVYRNIPGTSIADLLADPDFPANPDESSTLTRLKGTASGSNFGATMITTIIAPETGTYRFYLASDDNGSLLFSSNGTDPANAAEIASVPGWTASEQWDKYPSQMSVEIQLTAGQHYYLEARMKEGGGAEPFEVAWTTPSNTNIEIIDGLFIAAPKASDSVASITAQPQNVSTTLGETITLTATVTGPEPHLFQWQKNGENYGDPQTEPLLEIPNSSAYLAGDWQLVFTSVNSVLTSAVASVEFTDVGQLVMGGLWQEIYNEVSGGEITDLTSHPKFPTAPDSSGPINVSYQGELGNSYGQRWTGWVTPTETARYRFYGAADDQITINLSPTEFRCHADEIFRSTSYTGERNYDQRSPSDWIELTAGNRYFIEVLHTEGGGGDHASITWQKEGDPTPIDSSEGIPAANLQYRSGGADPAQLCPPHAAPDSGFAALDQLIVIPVLANDLDNDIPTLTVTAISIPSTGTASISPDQKSIRYHAPANSSGISTFTYTVTDADGLTATGTITITLDPLGNGLRLHYDFEDTSADTARDVSGNAHDGTLNSALADCPDPLFGNTVQVAGGSQSIAVDPTVFDDLTTAGTISYWAYATEFPGNFADYLTAFNSNGSRIVLWHYPWSSQAIMDWGDGVNGSSYDRTLKFSGIDGASLLNRWNHIALTKDTVTGIQNIYIDGQLIQSSSNETRLIGIAANFTFGGDAFRGKLDELRVYDRALTAVEITQLYQAPTRPRVSLTATPGVIGEASGGSITYTLTRVGDLTDALTVQIGITGSAQNGTDFQTIPTSFEIPAGSAISTFSLVPINDSHGEHAESVVIQILADNAYLITAGDPVITITSDDTPKMTHLEVDPEVGTIDFSFAANEEVSNAEAQWSSTLEAPSWAPITAPAIDMGNGIKRLPIPTEAMNATHFFIRWKVE